MNDLQLTKESIANEGIEIKLTQADVIDALVDEQMELIIDRYEVLYQRSLILQQKVNQVKENARNKAFEEAKKKLPKNITVKEGFQFCDRRVSLSNHKCIDFLYIRKYSNNNGSIQFERRNNESLYVCTLSYTSSIDLILSVKDLNITNSLLQINYSFKYPAALVKEINDNNEMIDKFCKEFPEAISPSKISKTIKNKFTKEILKTSSPDFKKKLKAGFGLTL